MWFDMAHFTKKKKPLKIPKYIKRYITGPFILIYAEDP